MHLTKDEEEGFWLKVNKNGPIPQDKPELGPCWLWTGGTSHALSDPRAYGRFYYKGKRYRAHRVAYIILRGSEPVDLHLDHLCRNRMCVNPDHLDPVTAFENNLRGESFSAINARKTNCPKGHPLVWNKTNTRRRCPSCESSNKQAKRLALKGKVC